MTNYPAQIDNGTSLPIASNTVTPVDADLVNKLRSAILAIESELGIKPSGSSGTIKARLDNLTSTISSYQNVTFNGDLSGTNLSQNVIGIQGKPIASNLNSLTIADDGYTLFWNGVAGFWSAGKPGSTSSSLSPLTFAPVPPNNNLYRGMFVWNTASVLNTQSGMQTLIDFCEDNGINLLFLAPFQSQSNSYWLSHFNLFQKFIHTCHESGIQVYATFGNDGYGTDASLGNYGLNQQNFVQPNIIKPFIYYQTSCDNNPYFPNSKFDGVMLDARYWVGTYNDGYVVGLCDLGVALKKLLNIPIWATANYNLTTSGVKVTYDGYYGDEGYALMNVFDGIVVKDYFDNSTNQISNFNKWFNYASQPGIGFNKLVMCASNVNPASGSSSYNKSLPGNKAAMEVQHTLISNNYIKSPYTNLSFGGQVIENYGHYKDML